MKKCMDYLVEEEEHSSWGEPPFTPPYSLSVRGNPSMGYPTDVKQVYREAHALKNYFVSPICLYFSDTHFQGMVPRWGTKYDGFHGPFRAMNCVDAGHSLENVGKLSYSSWCDYFTPTMMYILQAFQRHEAEKKCWGRHLSYLILWKLRIKLRWLHMREHLPHYLAHMAASMLLLMIPQD